MNRGSEIDRIETGKDLSHLDVGQIDRLTFCQRSDNQFHHVVTSVSGMAEQSGLRKLLASRSQLPLCISDW